MSPGEAVTVASFRGQVRCARLPGAPLFTLSGESQSAGALSLTFSAPAPADLPARLDAPRIERADGTRYRICVAGHEWRVDARAVHLHREVPSFYTVVTPRPPPWHRRLLWQLLLALAAHPWGLSLLRRLRR
jgi:hypothetical protein